LCIAYVWYVRKPGTAAALAAKFPRAYRLLEHKFWVDEIYGAVIVGPLLMFSRFFLGGLFEGALVNGAATGLTAGARGGSWLSRRMQSGNIRSYAGWLALGAAAVIAIVVFGVHHS
jgi:NADH-quinone oxidoreductase subunit L